MRAGPTRSTPISLWLPGLFNPTAYNTAIKQVTARRTGNALDKMATETHVTTMLTPDKAKASRGGQDTRGRCVRARPLHRGRALADG